MLAMDVSHVLAPAMSSVSMASARGHRIMCAIVNLAGRAAIVALVVAATITRPAQNVWASVISVNRGQRERDANVAVRAAMAMQPPRWAVIPVSAMDMAIRIW